MSSKEQEIPDAFERKILTLIYGPVKDERGRRIRYNAGIYDL
jgi:hypothetical protein